MNLSKVDQYFLTRDAPIGKYRRLDLKKIRNWLMGLAGLAVIGLLFTGNGEHESPPAATSIDNHTAIPQGATANGIEQSSNGGFYLSSLSGLSPGAGRTTSNRQLSASQLVSPQGNSLGLGLPSGTAIPARLLNRIVTSDSRNPAIAVITKEFSAPSGFSIPMGTKVLGNAQNDSGSNRVQVTFHTFVFENGIEQPFSAVAVMRDGSSGIVGDYHSQILKKEGGRFLGNFVAGFAEGFKDREKTNGLPFEPGNLKNAALNGLSESASAQAKAQAEEMQSVVPYVTVESGTEFLVFIERGMSL